MRILWHPLLHVTFLTNFSFLGFPNIPFLKDSAPVFFSFFLLYLFWSLGLQLQSHPKASERRRGKWRGDYRREVQDKRIFPGLAAFSDHGRKRRWNLCSTFLCPNASTFLLYTLPKSFSNQLCHLRRTLSQRHPNKVSGFCYLLHSPSSGLFSHVYFLSYTFIFLLLSTPNNTQTSINIFHI